jgi:multidrug efflux pump subunit AcrA (membrane-fusion protein)
MPPGRALALGLRVALVALAVGAAGAALRIALEGAPAAARRYGCPMHAEVVADEPGDCPVCGMALVERRDAAHPADRVAFTAVRTSSEAANLLKFSVGQVRRNALPSELFAPARVGADGALVARLYRDEAAALEPDEAAAFTPGDAPAGAAISVRAGPRAATPDDPRDPTVDVVFHAAPGAVVPGQVGWIKLAYRTRAMLVVRSTAILPSPDGPYVLVFSAEHGALVQRRVTIGKDYAGMTAVVAGLRDRELVVMANALAFDAERRLEARP